MKQLIYVLFLISVTNYSQTVVKTKEGKVEGYIVNDIQIFKGIPFAQPPVGDLRWKAPQPVLSWEGVKQCKDFGPSPIQNKPEPFMCWSAEFIAKPEALNEDCLYLNIWTPKEKSTQKLPVFVWIYGGGLSSGSANCDIYDGLEMAKQGVVFVSLNYRVGVLGFMAHPDLSKESGHDASGNYGFMDQLQALKWIQENIEAFGGDSGNVTIAGQSAGSFSVNAQIASPLAKGVFQKAICQSGGILGGRPIMDLPSAERQGLKFMELAEAKSLEELRQLPATELQKFSNNPEAGRFGVVLDDYFLPKDIVAHLKAGKQNQVKVLTGWVTGDGGLFPSDKTTAESFKRSMVAEYGEKSDQLFKLFPADSDEEAKRSQQKMELLNFAGKPAYLLAKYMGKEVWLYEFAHVPTDKPGFPNYGAFHTSEVPFALHTLDQWDRSWKPEERLLENQMSGYWVNFAKKGNPNGEGLPQWNVYNLANNEILTIDTDAVEMEKKYSQEFRLLTQ